MLKDENLTGGNILRAACGARNAGFCRPRCNHPVAGRASKLLMFVVYGLLAYLVLLAATLLFFVACSRRNREADRLSAGFARPRPKKHKHAA